jgi:hypothetical protein
MALIATVGIGAAGKTTACYVHSGQYQGLKVQHALSVPVSLATRQALVDGELRDIPRATAEQRTAALKQLTAVVGFFGKQAERDVVPAADAPSFAVLLTESGLWTGFTPTSSGKWQVRQHLSDPGQDDVVIVLSDPTMAALLQGRLTVAQAAERGLLESAASGSSGVKRSEAAFSQLVDRFAQSNYAGFELRPKLPVFGFTNPISSID